MSLKFFIGFPDSDRTRLQLHHRTIEFFETRERLFDALGRSDIREIEREMEAREVPLPQDPQALLSVLRELSRAPTLLRLMLYRRYTEGSNGRDESFGFLCEAHTMARVAQAVLEEVLPQPQEHSSPPPAEDVNEDPFS